MRSVAATVAVSVNQGGGSIVGGAPSISGDGRYVAFASKASDIVPDDTNADLDGVDSPPSGYDVFVRDREACTTARVSVDSVGNQANHDSVFPALSRGGRAITFISYADNLVSDDTNHEDDVFVHGRLSGQTERINVDSMGRQAVGKGIPDAGVALAAPMSDDGSVVLFTSAAYTLAPELDAMDCSGPETCALSHVFARNRAAATTTLVSVDHLGIPADHGSWASALSGDGRTAAFGSRARLIPEDDSTDLVERISNLYLKSLDTGDLRLASRTIDGSPLRPGDGVALSADGCIVAFTYLVDDGFELGGLAVFDCQLGYATSIVSAASRPVVAMSADASTLVYMVDVGTPSHPALAKLDRGTSQTTTQDLWASDISAVAASEDARVIAADVDGRIVAIGELPGVPTTCERVVHRESLPPLDAALCDISRALHTPPRSDAILPNGVRAGLDKAPARIRSAASSIDRPKRRLFLAVRKLGRVLRVVRRSTARVVLDGACGADLEVTLKTSRTVLRAL